MLSIKNYKEHYSRVENGSETSSQPENIEPSISSKYWVASRVISVFTVAWHSVCLFMFISGAIMMTSALRWVPSDKYCASKLSIWSPLLEAIEYEEYNWESGLALKNSGYTGPPTAELEDKWKKIIEVPSVIIPTERIPSLNRSVEQGFLRAPSSSPTSGYVAVTEVFHQLHCINVLRQYVWQDSYPEGLLPTLLKFNSPEVAREHADHCVETLRQAVTCNSDVTPFLIYQKKRSPGSGPSLEEDFGGFHKCRRFDKLLDWVNKNGVIVTWSNINDDM
ncbi:hypothetical protein LY76DRAFT_529575 [Colletotrichum caudatum]|nr:hypothetical protein LY76DRAFT_529575 [Colletotrichum caudatum]